MPSSESSDDVRATCRIHIKEDAQPVACHKAASIPLHWQDQVHADLERDEALGVIERVPLGEPVDWCHRMVVTRKPDGSPRRTVDLSPLNKYCKRETHNSESPFNLARRVPRKTWKTVVDAWNGFHSVPLRESDMHLTTFITPFGRWRYRRAPQGYLSSGDGYNRRLDAILADFERKERIVDDTLHYDTDLEDHWWRTIDLLSTLGKSGIVLNPKKFQFAQRNVQFAGFHIGEDTIDPLPKYFDAIRNFPTPTSTTDIRSWFRLVNQVTNYAQLRDYMTPFRRFLSPRCSFTWDKELDQAFEKSKTDIVEAIRRGVEIFDLNRPTCLRPDFSNKGIGYFLFQKHCECSSQIPDCCAVGWRISMAGSRFLTPTEQRYAPIEGEALALVWGLEQTRFFTLGCDNLTIVTDHKPLVKIFGDRTLDEINNTRLFRLKQRALPWYFNVRHLPGTTNHAADAASRNPSPSTDTPCTLNDADISEAVIAAAIRRDTESMTSITWDLLQKETRLDQDMVNLLQAIQNGFPDESRHSPSTIPFWQYRHGMYECDGVILFNDRVVVPASLRPMVLQALHSAHQGVNTMSIRARSIIFWPGMTEDIQSTRAQCQDCNASAPSQAPIPTTASVPPSTPFEEIFADYFDCDAHYLIVGDRLSGWTDVFRSPHGSPQAGADGLVACLRSYCTRFGVPTEISSDGGPEFVAHSTQDFLRRWGISHRLSSAYNAQSNGRAEAAVKVTKRLLRSNTEPSGTLNTDRFLRAMMQLRNTPDPDCNVSPAMIVFGRPIRDAFAFINRLDKFSNHNIRPTWREAWEKKEEALRERFHKTAERLNGHARQLPDLGVGDRCYVQNQTGNHPKRWDRSGTVIDLSNRDSYVIKVDGTGRLTRRNRRFLRKFTPASPVVKFEHLKVSTRATASPADDASLIDQPHSDGSNYGETGVSKAPPIAATSDTRMVLDPRNSPTASCIPDESDRGLKTPVRTRHSRQEPVLGLRASPVTPCIPDESSGDRSTTPARPKRSRQSPKQYEPKSGEWVRFESPNK